MAKKPVSLLHLHKLFREVWDEEWDQSKGDWRSNNKDGGKDVVLEGEQKKKEGGADISERVEISPEELGPGAMLSHQGDIFHPDNLVQKSSSRFSVINL